MREKPNITVRTFGNDCEVNIRFSVKQISLNLFYVHFFFFEIESGIASQIYVLVG